MPIMPFGKWKGYGLEEVPDDYLFWIARERIAEPRWLLREVEKELRRRRHGRRARQDCRPSGVVLTDAVRRWFNKLALIHHPDRGGSDERMQVVNSAYLLLKEELGL